MASHWVSIAVAMIAAAATGAAAQDARPYKAPHLSNGDPDLQGVWQNPRPGPNLEPGGLGKDLVVSADEGARLGKELLDRQLAAPGAKFQADLPARMEPVRVRGQLRTRLLVEPADGKLPYTPEAEKAVAAWQTPRVTTMNEGAADPESLDLSLRCLTAIGGAPLLLAGDRSLRQIFQSSAGIAILTEDISEVRNVRMGGDFQPAAIQSLTGDLVGHWEGDVLVVETRNFNLHYPMRTPLRDRPIVLGPDSRMIERFWRVSDSELDYSFTVIDPTIYTKPWLGEYAMVRSHDIPQASACHEGNYAMALILQGTRDEEAAARGVKLNDLH